MPASRNGSSGNPGPNQEPIAQSEIDAQLIAPKPHIANAIQEGDILFLAFQRAQKEIAIVALHNGLVAGELVSEQLTFLRNRIKQGVIFTARVTRKIGGLINLQVKPANIESKRPHRLLYRYKRIAESSIRSRIFGIVRSRNCVVDASDVS